MTKATLRLGGVETQVDVEGVVKETAPRPAGKKRIPEPSDKIKSLKDHLADADWRQDVIGRAVPSDLIRAAQLLGDEYQLNSFQAQEWVTLQAQGLTPPTRMLMHWVFASRVRLRGLLPYLRPAVALTWLPSGGRFPADGVDRLGCTNTVVMQIAPQEGGRMEILMRGYVARKDPNSGEILGVGGPEGNVFCKNLRLVPGLRRLDTMIKHEKRNTRGGPDAVRRRVVKLMRRRSELKLDETVYEDARAARPDLENAVIMRTGMEMLMALRAFGEVRRASDELDRLARLCGAGSGEALAAAPHLAGEGSQGRERVEELVGVRQQAQQYHWSLGHFHFQRFLHAFARDEAPAGVGEQLRFVPGIDGPCLDHQTAEAVRARGGPLRPLLQYEDLSELLHHFGVPMFEGRQVLHATSEGEGVERRWQVKLAGDDPDAPPREMTSEEYLGGYHRHMLPQVCDVVYGVSRSRKTRCPRPEEMRFAHEGVPVSLSVDDVNRRFAEWQKRRKS